VTDAVRAHLAAVGVATDVLDEVAGATAHMSPERLGGAVLLGVKGVVVVGHGASTARGVASCVGVAVQAVEQGLVPRTAEALAELVSQRRERWHEPVPGGGARGGARRRRHRPGGRRVDRHARDPLPRGPRRRLAGAGRGRRDRRGAARAAARAGFHLDDEDLDGLTTVGEAVDLAVRQS
jgi:hypothetical protein